MCTMAGSFLVSDQTTLTIYSDHPKLHHLVMYKIISLYQLILYVQNHYIYDFQFSIIMMLLLCAV